MGRRRGDERNMVANFRERKMINRSSSACPSRPGLLSHSRFCPLKSQFFRSGCCLLLGTRQSLLPPASFHHYGRSQHLKQGLIHQTTLAFRPRIQSVHLVPPEVFEALRPFWALILRSLRQRRDRLTSHLTISNCLRVRRQMQILDFSLI